MAMDIIARGMGGDANKRIDGIEVGGAPYIQAGYWWVWNTGTSNYINSGIIAEGVNGVGIVNIVLVSKVGITSTYRINFTNGTNYEYIVLDGEKGDNATINGRNSIEIVAGDNVSIEDTPTGIKISSTGTGTGAVNSVNGMQGDVILDAEDVKALPDTTVIPTKTSELANDSGFVTNSDIPDKLPNPYLLKFTGGSTKTYDGSSEVTVDISNTLNAGDNITIISNTISSSTPITTQTTFGGIKAKNRTTEDNEVVIDSVTGIAYTNSGSDEYILPTAAIDVLGGVKVGSGLSMNGEIMNVNTTQIATKTEIDDINTQLEDKADLIGGIIPAYQLPSFVDDVIEVPDFNRLPDVGETGKIYITLDTNKTYRWGGTTYIPLQAGVVLGETAETAYRGDRGKIAYDHTLRSDNPHNVSKEQVGLGNVDNTSDLNKPINTATQDALTTLDNEKQDLLESGTNIKTINNQSILGSGNIDILVMHGFSIRDKNLILTYDDGSTPPDYKINIDGRLILTI